MIRKAWLAVAALACSILLARWIEEGDYYNPWTGRQHCGAPPSAIKDWQYTNRTRRPADRVNLDRWLQENRDQINSLFGPFCLAPLHSAARFGREDLAEVLLAQGADVGAQAKPSGDTALHLAARYGHSGIATVLVARGADVNARSKEGRTPLHDAAFGLAGTSDLEGRLAVATLLLARGADVNAREKGSNRTPLDSTAGTSFNGADNQRMIQLLLAAGATEGTRDVQVESPGLQTLPRRQPTDRR